MKIKLKKSELSKLNQYASLRWQLCRVSGVFNQRKDNSRSDDDVDKLGLKGEFVVSKLFNINFNPSLIGIDDGCDLWINEISIDVKSTFYENGKLLFKSPDAFKSDISILVCQINEEIYKVACWITKDFFIKNFTSFNGSSGVCLEQDKLFKIEKLWLHLKQKELSVVE